MQILRDLSLLQVQIRSYDGFIVIFFYYKKIDYQIFFLISKKKKKGNSSPTFEYPSSTKRFLGWIGSCLLSSKKFHYGNQNLRSLWRYSPCIFFSFLFIFIFILFSLFSLNLLSIILGTKQKCLWFWTQWIFTFP